MHWMYIPHLLHFEPLPPRNPLQRVEDDLEERDQGEAHAEPQQAARVRHEVDDGGLLVPPDPGHHRVLDVDIHHHQVVLSIDIEHVLKMLDPENKEVENVFDYSHGWSFPTKQYNSLIVDAHLLSVLLYPMVAGLHPSPAQNVPREALLCTSQIAAQMSGSGGGLSA